MEKTKSRPNSRWGKIQREILKILKGNDLRVYSLLATYADKEGECWPSVETIAKDLGIHPRNVQKHLANLEEQGWIKRNYRKDQSTRYQIYFAKMKKEPGSDKQNSSKGALKDTTSGVADLTVPGVVKNAVSGVAKSTTQTDHRTDHNNRPIEQNELVVVSNKNGEYKLSDIERSKFEKLFSIYGQKNEVKSSAEIAFTKHAAIQNPDLLEFIETGLSSITKTFMTTQMNMLVEEYYEIIETKKKAKESKIASEKWNKEHPEQTM